MNPTNRATKSDIEEWLKPVLQKEGLKNYTINVSGNSEKGDGYLGDVTFVDVHGTTESDHEKMYNFVVKSGKKSSDLRVFMPVRNAFENEIYFYNEVLSAFVDFQSEKRIREPFNNVAKCYGTFIFEDMEVLILDNMKKKEYFLHNRKQPMNKEHVIKVIKTYGKLHAISFALRDQKPDLFEKLAKKLIDVLKRMSEASKPQPDFNLYQNMIDLAKKENDTEMIEKCLILNEKVKKINDLTDPTDPYAVILHGDCWNNNFMFKYEDNGRTKPSNVCFLDFQLSRLASPIYDLGYFLFTCLSPENVDDFDEINNIYYESFSNFLKELGSDPDKMFPFEEVQNQWARFSMFGLAMMPPLMKICVSEGDEVPDLAETAESGGEMTDFHKSSIRNMEQYRYRTFAMMKLAIKRGFI